LYVIDIKYRKNEEKIFIFFVKQAWLFHGIRLLKIAFCICALPLKLPIFVGIIKKLLHERKRTGTEELRC